MNKAKVKGGFLIFGIILAVLAIPATIISYATYFAWDSQMEGRTYKVVFEKDSKLYDTAIYEISIAFDRGTNDDQFYLSTFNYLGDLIALSYNDYVIEKTDNPFFAGNIRVINSLKYYEQQTKYSSPKDSYQVYKFYDQNHNEIFAYDPTTESDYVVRIRPTFPMFSKRKYYIGVKQNYLNATKVLKEKLNKNLKIRTDDVNKLLILWFE